jgi:uncharacterized protein YegP (UPF0339 family)
MASKQAKLEVTYNAKGPRRYWYQLRGVNGSVLFASDQYKSQRSAVTGAEAALKAIKDVAAVEVVE